MAGQNGNAHGILVIEDHGKTGGSGRGAEHSAAYIGIVLYPRMARKDSAHRDISVVADDRLSAQNSPLVNIGVIAGNGIVKDPCGIVRLKGKVALALHKST